MSTTTKMWAVFDPEGKPVEWTLLTNPIWCKEYFARNADLWENYKKEGYTCRPVRVTIEEIKHESQRDH